MKHFIMVLAALALMVGTADAQHKPAINLPIDPLHLNTSATPAQTQSLQSQILAELSKPFVDIANFINSDAVGAATLSVEIPTLQDTNGQACWAAMQEAGAIFKAHPVPLTGSAMTDIEALRLLAMTTNKLCANAACTVVFADVSNIATAAIGTVPNMSAINIPSLQSLCAKVPQIAPMLPVSATVPPTAAPAK